MQRPQTLILAMIAMAAVGGLANAAPSQVDEGRKIALRACGGCHVVDRGPSPQPGAVPFRSLSDRMDVETLPSRFGDGMMASHSRMPMVRLDAAEVAAVTAYLKSIQTKPKAAKV
jgi:mono/diheme cytochrome c family protein